MKPKTILCGSLIATAAVLAAAGMLWHFRPLLSSHEFTAVRQQGEHQTALPVYVRPGFPGEYWIPVQSSWFVVRPDTGEVLAANSPGHIPWLHFNHDMTIGVLLDDRIKSGGERPEKSPCAIRFTDGRGHNIQFLRKTAQPHNR